MQVCSLHHCLFWLVISLALGVAPEDGNRDSGKQEVSSSMGGLLLSEGTVSFGTGWACLQTVGCPQPGGRLTSNSAGRRISR